MAGRSRGAGGTVAFAVPVETAYAYLVDPRNRPAWQSSLRRVDDVDGEPRVGQTWTDVTVPGLRPAMRTTVLEPPRGGRARWAETGVWRGVAADLELRFDATGPRTCQVRVEFAIRLPGPRLLAGPLGRAASLVSAPPVTADLRRAAALLADGGRTP